MQEALMADTTTITIRIPVSVRDELQKLAEHTRRSRSQVAADALAAYAHDELEIIEGILRGLEDAKAGRVTPHKQAMARLRQGIKRRTANKARQSA
jgi:predicted transcriptional regulator